MKPWVLLDRDGVINYDSDAYIKSPEEWLPLPGSLEAIALLHKAGFHIGVATNQSGIARGMYPLSVLEAIHAKMHDCLIAVGGKIEAIAFCPHGPQDECDCRKPKPGLLEQLSDNYGFSLKNVPYVGDSLRDLEAAKQVDARPILVRTGKGIETINKHSDKLQDILIFDDLLAVACHLISERE